MLSERDKRDLQRQAEERRLDSECGIYTIIATDRQNGLRVTHRYTALRGSGEKVWQPWVAARI